MILLDTCALVYWSLDPEKLTPKAQEYIKETDVYDDLDLYPFNTYNCDDQSYHAYLNLRKRLVVFILSIYL